MVLLRRVTILRDLDHVEAELGFQVRRFILRILDRLAKLGPQLRILDRYRLVDCGMSGDVRGIVGQRAQRKGIFVYILTLEQQFANEVSAANVMHQIAEFLAAEWIVTQVLNDSASVSVGVRLSDLVLRQSGVSLEQQRPNLIGP